MRYLHPVQMHEKFVASGRYQHYRRMTLPEDYLKHYGAIEIELAQDWGDGLRFYEGFVPFGVNEEWTIHELPDQSWLIRCDRYNAKLPDDPAWLGEILRRSDGEIERIDLRCYHKSRLVAEASCVFFEQSVLIGRKHLQRDGSLSEREQLELELPAGYIADSGVFTINRGLTVQQMLKRSQPEYTVFYPQEPEYEDIEVPYSTLFRGHSLTCKLEYLRTDSAMIQDQAVTGEMYETVFTGKDSSGSSTWDTNILINAKGIALRYPHFMFIDRLEQYAHRPEPKRTS